MAANPVKGEVLFEVDDETYTLVYDFNAICTVEEVFDLPITKIGEKMAKGMRAGDLRTLIAAGLQAHHPGLTELAAGALIGRIGAQEAADKLAQAMQAAFPAPEEGESTSGPRMRPSRRG